METSPIRILAIDPTSKGFGYAVLEGSERLLVVGLATIRPDRDDDVVNRMRILFDAYQPHGFVTEVGNRKSRRSSNYVQISIGCALTRNMSLHTVTRADVQSEFGMPGMSRWEIGVALARLFPELEPWLPEKRKFGFNEAERMNIFDAASFALTVVRRLERRQ